MTRKAWTGAEISDARRWRAEGLTYPQIATVLERSTSAVRHKMNGIPKGYRAETPDVSLAEELAAAHAERDTAPPFKPGPLEW